jgi:hypothetical protein
MDLFKEEPLEHVEDSREDLERLFGKTEGSPFSLGRGSLFIIP